MSCCKKPAKNQVQKVVIPKGMINPGETTIIEIPSNLQRQPIVVAKRKSQSEMDDDRYANTRSGAQSGPQSSASAAGSRQSTRSQKSDQQPDRKDKKNKKKEFCPGYTECRPGGNSGTNQSAADLEKTEKCEREQFLHDLEEFQRARRKLLANASFMANKDFT